MLYFWAHPPPASRAADRAIRYNSSTPPKGACAILATPFGGSAVFPLLSLARTKNGILAVFRLQVFASQKPGISIHAGLPAGDEALRWGKTDNKNLRETPCPPLWLFFHSPSRLPALKLPPNRPPGEAVLLCTIGRKNYERLAKTLA
jgi:hypothetical protein